MLEGDRQSTLKALRVQASEANGPHRAEATAPFMEVACPQRILYLPPSPPYTDPRLKFPIFLPSLDDHLGVLITSYLPPGGDMDSSFAVTHGKEGDGGISPLLSPPYSPRRGLLQLTDVEREREPIELLSPGAQSESSTVSDDQDWRSFDDSDFLEQHCVRFKDIDLGGESDDEWDQPSFLKETPAKEPSDGLDLNLFGASPPESSPSQRCSISSPRTKTSELPPIEDLDTEGQGSSILKSSDFDVFQNGWDEVSNSLDDLSSDEGTILDEGPQVDEEIDDALPCFSPESPSRRTSVGLPDVGAALEATGLMYSTGSLFLDRSSIERSLQTPQHHPADIPSEAFQSPYSFPFILSSPPPRSPPLYSLLFAPAEPQNASAPEYPEGCLQVLFNGDLRAQSYLLEESRLRAMKQEMNTIETQARSQEAMLTEYIARLNAMKPPPYITSDSSLKDLMGTGLIDHGPANVQLAKQFPVNDQAQSIFFQANAPINSMISIDDFYAARRREVQNAVAARASERRRRKQAKERARELEALLLLKAGQIRDVERWMRSLRERVVGADEPVVLAASGPDHTNTTICDDEAKQTSGDKHGDEVRQLVAKMIFRRRDSSRPLSGKSTQPTRSYVSSSLSQELEPHADDADDLLRMDEEPSS